MTRLNGLAITSGTAISLGVSGLDEIYLESKKKRTTLKSPARSLLNLTAF